MKIIVIGGTGTIGKEVVKALEDDHEVVSIGHNSGDYTVDLNSKESIEKMFSDIENIDGIISTAGLAQFGPLESLTDNDFLIGLNNKLMGQVNLIRIGASKIKSDGFIILTSGVLAQNPIPQSSAISMVNAGLEAFVKAAALELPKNIRVNVVSPSFLTETLLKMGMDSDGGIPAKDTARVYKEAIRFNGTGTTINVEQELEKLAMK